MRAIETPEVFLIAAPQIRTAGMLEYLRRVGGESWFNRVFQVERDSSDPTGSRSYVPIPAAEGLVEFMGRLCYRSWEPGLNKNVTRVREDRGDYLLNILKSEHGSVLEHAQFSFACHDVARFVYDEIVRHRVGVAISGQSGRYVRMDEIGLRIPPFLKPRTQKLMQRLVEEIEETYVDMVQIEGLDDEGVDFAHKKRVTSALRRIAPHGQGWSFGWSANVRTLRHVIEKRTDAHAEEEVRIWADQVGRIMAEECPLLFGDYALMAESAPDDVPEWITRFGRV